MIPTAVTAFVTTMSDLAATTTPSAAATATHNCFITHPTAAATHTDGLATAATMLAEWILFYLVRFYYRK
jgi:hypothetical protein